MSFSIRMACRHLSARKLRTGLVTLSITIGVAILFGLNGMLPPLMKAFRQNTMTEANQVDLAVSSRTRGVFAATMVDKVGGTAGVDLATGELIRPILLPEGTIPAGKGKPVTNAVLYGIDPATFTSVRPLRLVRGRLFCETDRDSLIISAELAERTGLAPGNTVTLPSAEGTTELTVVGLVSRPSTPGNEELFIPLDAAQRVFNLPGSVNVVEAVVRPGSNLETVRANVMTIMGPGFKLGGIEAGQEIASILEMGEVYFGFFGLMALLMGGFIIFNTFRTTVAERRREIGLLRAAGASRRTVMGLFLIEGLVQGVIGTLFGLAGGALMCAGILAGLSPLARSSWGVSLGGPSFTFSNLILAVGMGLGVTLLGCLLPAREAAKVPPVEAIRSSAEMAPALASKRRMTIGLVLLGISLVCLIPGSLGAVSLGIMLFITALVLLGPVVVSPVAYALGHLTGRLFPREGEVARRNITRHPARSAVTVTGVMIGLAILVALAGTTTSMTDGSLGYVKQSLRADYLFMPRSQILGGGNVGAAPDLADAVRKVPGVSRVTTLRQSTTEINAQDVQVVGIDPYTYPKLSGLQFSAGRAAAAYQDLAENDSLIANGVFAAKNKIKPGMQLTLQTIDGPRSYRVAGVGVDSLNAKTATVYISQSKLTRDFHVSTDLLIMADRKAGANGAAVRTALEKLCKSHPAFTLSSTSELYATKKNEAKGKMGVMYVLMLALTIPSLLALVNTLVINVLERTREIGVLRAIGATRSQVRRMTVVESLLLAATGTVFGIVAGVWLGYVMVGVVRAGGFILEYALPVGGILLGIAAGLLLGVIGARLPARLASQMNILDALHQE